jgi:hypothetical protein
MRVVAAGACYAVNWTMYHQILEADAQRLFVTFAWLDGVTSAMLKTNMEEYYLFGALHGPH